MQRSLISFVLLGLVMGPVSASAPIHIALRAAATVAADAGGFFTLGSVADLSGGSAAERGRLRAIRVGRAPLPDQVRQVTPGDVLLKLRQAGFHPERDAVVEGAARSAVTVTRQDTAADPGSVVPETDSAGPAPAAPAPPAAAPLIRRGSPITILIRDGDMTISARGVSRDDGGAGASIHVHREGVMTDLVVTVLDAQTVRLEL